MKITLIFSSFIFSLFDCVFIACASHTAKTYLLQAADFVRPVFYSVYFINSRI